MIRRTEYSLNQWVLAALLLTDESQLAKCRQAPLLYSVLVSNITLVVTPRAQRLRLCPGFLCVTSAPPWWRTHGISHKTGVVGDEMTTGPRTLT